MVEADTDNVQNKTEDDMYPDGKMVMMMMMMTFVS